MDPKPPDTRGKSRKSAPATEGSDEPARSGRAAIVGRPNAGKSSLLNALVGRKMAITTPRPGTTRTSVLAVYSADEPKTQIAFVDTPGLHRPKSALGSVLVDEARAGLAEVDCVVFVATAPTDADIAKAGIERIHIPSQADAEILALVKDTGRPVILALNKVDRVSDKRWLLPLMQRWQSSFDFAAIVPISALRNKNLEGLISEVRKLLPEGLLYDDEFLTDRSERFFVAELVREAAMMETRQEIPHGLAVTIDQYIETPEIVRIAATLVVEKDSHKAIVIGSRGSMIKEIGTAARRSIETFLERKVFLELWVRVDEGWTGDPNKARRHLRESEGS